jgi:hypothetical protein
VRSCHAVDTEKVRWPGTRRYCGLSAVHGVRMAAVKRNADWNLAAIVCVMGVEEEEAWRDTLERTAP